MSSGLGQLNQVMTFGFEQVDGVHHEHAIQLQRTSAHREHLGKPDAVDVAKQVDSASGMAARQEHAYLDVSRILGANQSPVEDLVDSVQGFLGNPEVTVL